MKRVLFLSLVLTLVGCSPLHGLKPEDPIATQYSVQANHEFNLPTYRDYFLEDPQFKARTAFLYTVLQHTQELHVHRMGGADSNQVYVAKDGHAEVVTRTQTDAAGNAVLEKVTDCLNRGSYNYSHPQAEPLGHFTGDMLPWMQWGNCEQDPSTVDQRIEAYVKDLELGLQAVLDAGGHFYLPEGFDFTGPGQSTAVAFFLSALKEARYNLNDFFTGGEPLAARQDAFLDAVARGFRIKFANRVDWPPMHPVTAIFLAILQVAGGA